MSMCKLPNKWRVLLGAILVIAIVIIFTNGSKSDKQVAVETPSASASATSKSTAIKKVEPLEAQNLITTNQTNTNFVVLDVRTADEFATGHIKGAHNLDYYASDIQTKIASLDQTKTYLVYCRTGHRSGLTTSKMSEAGLKNIYDLNGGIQAWQTASLPVE